MALPGSRLGEVELLGLHAGLRPLAGFAAFDVGFDIFLHLWPPEFAEY